MTPEEAKRLLAIEDPEDRDDAYEMAVFETRQFLLSKPVLLKTFQAKMNRLKKSQEAFLVLGGEESPLNSEPELRFTAVPEVLEHFIAYHTAKNSLKQRLANAGSFDAMEQVVNGLLELERRFVEPFSAYTGWTDEEVLISKDPDAMAVLSLLREQAASGFITLEELSENKNNLPAELTRELKRLSLHKNYLYE